MCSGLLCGGCGTLWVYGGSDCEAGCFVVDVGRFCGFGELSVQRVALWWVWDCLEWVWRRECAAGVFVLCVWDSLGECVCRSWLCGVCVWDSWGSECAAGGFVLCVWDSLWFWGSDCAVGVFMVGV